MAGKNVFRRFKNIKFDNVTIGGEYEFGMSPWTMIFLIGTKLKPTTAATQYFDSENDMKVTIARELLGMIVLEKNAQKKLVPGWHWEGARYSHEHNTQQFKFEKQSAFQVEFYVRAPKELEEKNDKKGMESGFKKLANGFAKMNNFQTSDLFEFKPAANVK